MSLIYKDAPTTKGDLWFPSECVTDKSDAEHNGWNLRHAALSFNDWMSEGQPINDWIGGGPRVDPQCEMLLEFKHQTDADKVGDLRLKANQLRAEFEALSKKWYCDTRHLSLISKKVAHPAYLRIVGMGESAIPLLLEALRDRPTHWFAALRATANTDPSPIDANPSQARDAWLNWGRSHGYIDYGNG